MRISIKLVTLTLLAAFGVSVAMSVPTYAATCATAADCIQSGANKASGNDKPADIGSIIKNIVNILLYALGAIAVIMIIIGGIRYTISQGDSSAITGAKNTILYAVIGLIVAILSYAIVNFIVDNIQ